MTKEDCNICKLMGLSREMEIKLLEDLMLKIKNSNKFSDMVEGYSKDLNLMEKELFLKGFAFGRFSGIDINELKEKYF